MFNNITSFFSSIPTPSLNGILGEAERVRCDDAALYSLLNSSRQTLILGMATSTILLAIGLIFSRIISKPKLEPESLKITPDLDLTVRPRMKHIITNPIAAEFVLKGHKWDSNDPLNLFNDCDLHSIFASEGLDKEELGRFKRFLASHLTKKIKKNYNFIIESTEKWARSLDGSSKKQCFNGRLSEAGRFTVDLCWNLFLGSDQPPADFYVPPKKKQTEIYPYNLSDINILNDAMDSSFEEIQIIKTVNNFKMASMVFAIMLSKSLFYICKDCKLQKAIFEELTFSLKIEESLEKAASKSHLIRKVNAESLRTLPGVSRLKRRNAREQFVIKNPTAEQDKIVVMPGDSVVIDLDRMRMDPQIVGENPKSFNLNRECLNSKSLKGLAWGPFSMGSHACPAANSMQKLPALIIANLVLRFHFFFDKNECLRVVPR